MPQAVGTASPGAPAAGPPSTRADTSETSAARSGRGGAAASGAGGGAAAGGGLVQSEERARGAAKLRTYAAYLRAAGGLSVAVLYLLLLGLWSSLNPLQSVMLKQWMQAMEDGAPG